MNEQIKNYFKDVDPILFEVITKFGSDADTIELRQSDDYFSDLCEAIVNQQLSEKAGRTIYNRFLALVPDRHPTYEKVLNIADDDLRSVGMSWSKVRYIKSLASSVQQNRIAFETIHTMDDESVIAELTKLHGIGRWSAEMFLMFSLGRPDIFSYGDAGLRRAIAMIYTVKTPLKDTHIKKVITPWSPYKTYACRILWKYLDTANLRKNL